jgi:hypothetical protein
MNRKTLIALGSFIVLAVLAVLALKTPEKGERASDKPRPLPKLDAAAIDTIEITKPGSPTTVLKSEGGKYKLTAPVAYAVDEPIAKAAFEGLAKMDVSDLVTDNKAKHGEFEVDDKGVHLVAKKGDKVVADIVIGKTTGPGTMVRLTGKDQVWRPPASTSTPSTRCRRIGATRASPRSPPPTPSRSSFPPKTAARPR